jgi:hypothetical protein
MAASRGNTAAEDIDTALHPIVESLSSPRRCRGNHDGRTIRLAGSPRLCRGRSRRWGTAVAGNPPDLEPSPDPVGVGSARRMPNKLRRIRTRHRREDRLCGATRQNPRGNHTPTRTTPIFPADRPMRTLWGSRDGEACRLDLSAGQQSFRSLINTTQSSHYICHAQNHLCSARRASSASLATPLRPSARLRAGRRLGARGIGNLGTVLSRSLANLEWESFSMSCG